MPGRKRNNSNRNNTNNNTNNNRTNNVEQNTDSIVEHSHDNENIVRNDDDSSDDSESNDAISEGQSKTGGSNGSNGSNGDNSNGTVGNHDQHGVNVDEILGQIQELPRELKEKVSKVINDHMNTRTGENGPNPPESFTLNENSTASSITFEMKNRPMFKQNMRAVFAYHKFIFPKRTVSFAIVKTCCF